MDESNSKYDHSKLPKIVIVIVTIVLLMFEPDFVIEKQYLRNQ